MVQLDCLQRRPVCERLQVSERRLLAVEDEVVGLQRVRQPRFDEFSAWLLLLVDCRECRDPGGEGGLVLAEGAQSGAERTVCERLLRQELEVLG